MIGALTALLVFQLVGEILSAGLGLPVPGPVIGMALLFAALVWRGSVPPAIEETSNSILKNLSVLFVPAGVGVMVHASTIGAEWLALTVALVGSTVITLAVTALVLSALTKKHDDA